MPLRTHFAFRCDPPGPMNDHAVAGAAVTSGDLLRPGKRRVAGHGPTGGVMAVRVRAAQIVDVLENLWNGFGHAVEVGHLIEKTVHGAFGTRAVVSDDVEDERVVHLAEVFNGLNDAPNLEVGILAETGENFHLPG